MTRNCLQLAAYIDQTLLKPEANTQQIERLCREAREYSFRAVFVNTVYVEMICRLLQGSSVRPGSVCGFPLGAERADIKVAQAEIIENAGAREIDMVANIGAIKDGDFTRVGQDIAAVRKALARETILKVILECTLLSEAEIMTAARVAADSGADFVKTSTGFQGGATVEHVRLLFDTVGNRIGVKASGGIRDVKTALAMIEAGASRIGTSAGAQIMQELLNRNQK